jgi:hypothetical protein
VSCISGDYTVMGVASAVGARVVSGEGITANLDTDLALKFRLVEQELADGRDLVVLHLKGADIAGHDRRPDLKVDFLERIDRELGPFLAKHPTGLRLAVAADHATPSRSWVITAPIRFRSCSGEKVSSPLGAPSTSAAPLDGCSASAAPFPRAVGERQSLSRQTSVFSGRFHNHCG